MTEIINDLFDEQAILAQADSLLNAISAKLKALPTIRVNLDGSPSLQQFSKDTKQLSADQKELADNTAQLKTRYLELKNARAEVALQMQQERQAARQKAAEDKANAAAEKQALSDKLALEKANAAEQKKIDEERAQAGRERIAQIQAQRIEEERLAAEQQSASVTNNPGGVPTNNQRAQLITPAPAAVVLTPLTDTQSTIAIIKSYEKEILNLEAANKSLAVSFKNGEISQQQYNRSIAISTEAIKINKAAVASLNKEVSLSAAVNNEERNSLGRAQALILQYTNAKKGLNLSTAEGILQNNNYNKAIDNTNKFILKNADAVTKQAKNVGNYAGSLAGSFNKLFGPLRTLANIIPGIGMSGLLLLAIDPAIKLYNYLTRLTGAAKEYAEQQKLIAEVNETAAKSYGKEAGSLQIIRAEIENTNVPMATRLQAIKDIKKEYPDYFKGLTNEQLLTGNVANAYDLAAAAILRKAQAQAAADKIQELSGKKQDIYFKSQADAIATNKKLREADATSALEFESGQTRGVNTGQSTAASIAAKRKVIQKGIKDEFNDRKKADEQEIKDAQAQIDFLLKIAVAGAKETVTIDKPKKTSSDKQLQALIKLQDSTFETYKKEQQREINLLKETASNESKSYDQRLTAYAAYIEKSEALIDAQAKHDKDAKRKEADAEIQRLNEEAVGKNAAQKARINENIIRTEQNLADSVTAIDKDAIIQKKTLDDDYLKYVTDLTQKDFQVRKAAGEADLDQFKKNQALKKQLAEEAISTAVDQKEIDLRTKFEIAAAGKSASVRKELEVKLNADIKKLRDQADLDKLKSDENSLQAQLIIFRALGLNVIDIEAQITANQLKQSKIRIGIADDEAQKKAEIEDKRKELVQAAENFITATVEGSFEARSNLIAEQQRLLEESTQRQIDNINLLGLTEVERTRETAKVQKDAAFKKLQLDNEQRKNDLAKARFDRIIAIAEIVTNTARAVAKDLIGNKAAIPFDIAIGALEIAAVLAKPLPKFKTGTDNAPRGKAIVGEIGPELIVPKSGDPYLSPSGPSLIDLAGGEKIFTADRTKDILNAINLNHLIGLKTTGKLSGEEVNNHMQNQILKELKTISSKSRIAIHNHVDIRTTAWYEKNIRN